MRKSDLECVYSVEHLLWDVSAKQTKQQLCQTRDAFTPTSLAYSMAEPEECVHLGAAVRHIHVCQMMCKTHQRRFYHHSKA